MHVVRSFSCSDFTTANNSPQQCQAAVKDAQGQYIWDTSTHMHVFSHTVTDTHTVALWVFPYSPRVSLMSFNSHDWGSLISTSSLTILPTNPHQLLQSLLTQTQYSTVRQALFPTALMDSFIWKPVTVWPFDCKPKANGPWWQLLEN